MSSSAKVSGCKLTSYLPSNPPVCLYTGSISRTQENNSETDQYVSVEGSLMEASLSKLPIHGVSVRFSSCNLVTKPRRTDLRPDCRLLEALVLRLRQFRCRRKQPRDRIHVNVTELRLPRSATMVSRPGRTHLQTLPDDRFHQRNLFLLFLHHPPSTRHERACEPEMPALAISSDNHVRRDGLCGRGVRRSSLAGFRVLCADSGDQRRVDSS
jgi:hypothetical protein